jgi:nucleotide-binding universal stress UspA family protein
MAVRELGGDHGGIDHVVLPHETRGTPAEALLDYAEETRCDLIAAGSAHHGRVERWMVGSVSTELVRDGRRSVLIVPPTGAPRR